MYIERHFFNDKTNEALTDTIVDNRFEMLEKVKPHLPFSEFIQLNDTIYNAIAFDTLKVAQDKKARPTQLSFYFDKEKTQLDTVMYLNTCDYYGTPIHY